MTMKEKVLAHLQALRAPLVEQRDSMAAELMKIVESDEAGSRKAEVELRAKIKAFNDSRELFDLDNLIAAVHRDGGKTINGMKSMTEQVAEKYGIE